jgi:hypothetical protein
VSRRAPWPYSWDAGCPGVPNAPLVMSVILI